MGIRSSEIIKFIGPPINPDHLTVYRNCINQAGGLGCQEQWDLGYPGERDPLEGELEWGQQEKSPQFHGGSVVCPC